MLSLIVSALHSIDYSVLTNKTATNANIISEIWRGKNPAMPAWVPAAAKEDMDVVFKAAIWCFTTLKSRYKIVSAAVYDGWITVRIERGGIVADVRVGQFKTVSGVTVKDGVLYISYTTVSSGNKWWWAVGGFVVGVVTSTMIYRAVK